MSTGWSERRKKKRVGEREGNEECFSRRLVTGEIPRIPFLYGESLSFSLTRFCYSFFFYCLLEWLFFFFVIILLMMMRESWKDIDSIAWLFHVVMLHR